MTPLMLMTLIAFGMFLRLLPLSHNQKGQAPRKLRGRINDYHYEDLTGGRNNYCEIRQIPRPQKLRTDQRNDQRTTSGKSNQRPTIDQPVTSETTRGRPMGRHQRHTSHRPPYTSKEIMKA